MLNPHARFASFIIGSGNRLAATAARTVADVPGSSYNPLFIYASPGLGKTHLLNAIGHEARLVDPSRTIEYVTVDDLLEAWNAALSAGEAEVYRRRFSEADLVLLDDAQLLTDRRELQAELLRLIDAMVAADRQIVLASDRCPEEIQALDERLIRRFAGGLIVDIGAPDYETRLAILTRRASDRGIVFEPAVLAAVASRQIETVRELLGALNRLIAHQAVQAAPLSVADVQVLLASLGHAGELAPADGRSEMVVEPAGDGAAQGRSEENEFGEFLSDLSAVMSQQIDRRRERLTEAVLRYQAAGVRTARLEQQLTQDTLIDPGQLLEQFSADVDTLATIREVLHSLAPDLLNNSMFYDPDRVEEAESLLNEVREAGAPLPGPSLRFTLDGFLEGPSTRPLIEAIRSAARTPGEGYNPVVIVGPGGSGKSHLLHAFGHELRNRGLTRVAVLDARQFTDDLVVALGEGNVTRWRQRLRRLEAFLLDDIDSLAGKERSQEELYLLYNVLAESGRQMAFTTSAQPHRIEQLEPRLATRLSGGLVVELGPPDPQVRLAETEKLLGPGAEPELAEYLAVRPVSTLKELQLLIHRLQAAADERGMPLSGELARLILDGSTGGAQTRALRHGSGLVAPGAATLRSREKMVSTWPDISERLFEEWD